MRRAPITYRKLRLAVFFADKAEAVFNANDRGARGDMQYIHHVDVTTRERPVNPGRLQDVQLVGSIEGKPIPDRVGDSFYNGMTDDGIGIPSATRPFAVANKNKKQTKRQNP